MQLASGLDERIVFDRERDKRRRNLPSRLIAPADEVHALLANDGVAIVAVVDPRLEQHLDALPYLSLLEDTGGWAIDRVNP